jgi:molybdopterin converting factor small subunit
MREKGRNTPCFERSEDMSISVTKNKWIIPMYGLSREITELREVEVELSEGAGMAEVVAALRASIPSLEGPVIAPGQDRLMEQYKFNINGNFYFAGMDFKLKKGDRIALLVPMTGG